jgi:hypothetical protein
MLCICQRKKKNMKKNKGGRPEKVIKKNKLLGVKCSILEQVEIRQKAKQYNLSVSQYLRELGLKHKVIIRTLPSEVIAFQIKLTNLGSNLNQISKKRNMNNQLNAIERAELKNISNELLELVNTIRNYINDIQS